MIGTESKQDPRAELTLAELFRLQASATPSRTALVAGDLTLSYDRLLGETLRWARFLTTRKEGPNSLVAVVMEKGREQVVACLAIVEAGAAYLPIDPELPADRVRYLLENGDVRTVLTQSRIAAAVEWPAQVAVFSVDSDDPGDSNDAPSPPVSRNPDDLAFVLYTSGSTGQPKGVMIAHRGAVNAILRTLGQFGVGPDDKVLALTPLHHDMSVFDIFGVLAAGGTIVMPEASRRKDPGHWSELMRANRVTLWNSVPAMMEMLLEFAAGDAAVVPDSLRLAFLGGDWISVTLPRRLGLLNGRTKLVSVGGPTETTLWNIWYEVGEVDPNWKSIPYGRPIAGAKYFVMNPTLEECAVGEAGELCCAGVGLAKGYWKDAAQTAAKFTLHPRTGERLYRTGDMGRLLPDGNIEFLGRVDHQVKINGIRIEPGEIESTLQRHPDVRGAVVVADGDRGRQSLVAYVVAEPGAAPTDAGLRAYLSDKLPEYMIPTRFKSIDRLPLTANGKVDRQALPKLAGERPDVATRFVNAATELERELVEIWRELLRIDRVGVDDNLFDLGAQSIHVVQAHARLRRTVNKELGIVALFQYPTIESLAAYLTSLANEPTGNSQIRARADLQRAAQERRRAARMNVRNV